MDADAEAPPDVAPVPAERVLETLPPALVDLALWLADYYGSTPARALALIAPQRPAGRAPNGGRDGPQPPSLHRRVSPTRRHGTRAPADRGASCERRRQRPPGRRDGQRQEPGVHPRPRQLAAGRGAIVLVPEIALTPQTLGRFRARFGDRVAILPPRAVEAERRTSGSGSSPGGAQSWSGALRRISPRCRRSASSVSTRSTTPRTSGIGSAVRRRTVAASAAALRARSRSSAPPRRGRVLARARAARARRPHRRAAPDRAGRRPARGDRLRSPRRYSPSSAGSRKTAARRSSCSTAAALRPLSTAGPAASRAAARTATSRSRCMATARSAAITATRASRRGRRAPRAARPSSPGSGRGRSGSTARARAPRP